MKHKCSFCAFQSDDIVSCGKHYETMHKRMIPSNMSGEQFAYYIKTGREHGNCVVCKRPTKWNEKTHKYHRICSIRCARKYGEIKKLTNPKVQEEMLSHRKISGEYTWSSLDMNGVRQKFTYTGSYELDFLKYMDQVRHWPVNDLMMPCPHLFEYTYDRQKRFYIPDAYIPSLDLVIEIKDGDPNNPNHHANRHPDIMRVNRAKEKLKKEAVNKSGHHYLIIYNKEYQGLEKYIRTNDVRYLSEGISDSVNTILNNIINDISTDVRKIITDIIDDWRDEVKEHKLEKYCELSMRLNDYVYDAIDSDDFEKQITKDKVKEFVTDLVHAGNREAEIVFSFMDSDDTIKSTFKDPYVIYSPEYKEARDKLYKWKKLPSKCFVGQHITFEFVDDDETRRLVLTYTEPEDDD